ncbi:STP1 protein [Plasmodium ovale wallikeri]|uniref:STP1 protein n=1 Tax=Plasmodium ovale wallikeri TaxID=864142 RepID=A0A1A9A7D7_PLAOA|nr:STP1 protein [Plasmodium ovale wallikeri]
MDNFLGYTTNTHDIPIEVFLAMIESDIKNVIRKYGHKNCGLSYEDACDKIQTIITTKKTFILKLMNEHGKNRLNTEWRREKNGFLNRLFEEEGFINVCFPKKYTKNPSLYEIKSKHIQFCKERDVLKAAVEANPVFSECVKYNSWINTKTTLLTREILGNVSVFSLPTVKKYFSTKAHPQGYYPPDIYRHSKLDCTQYNPPTSSHSQKPTATPPTNSLHPPTSPDVKKGSKEKNGKSGPDVDSRGTKIKSDEDTPLKPKSLTVDSGIPSSTKIQLDGTAIDQDAAAKSKVLASPVNVKDSKKDSTPIHHQPSTVIPSTVQAEASPKGSDIPPVVQHSPLPTATTSLESSLSPVNDTTSSLTITTDLSINSGSHSSADQHPPSPVTNDQEKSPHSSTTPATSSNRHTTQTSPASSDPDSSLAEPQPPPITAHRESNPSQDDAKPASSSASIITTTVTITTTAPATDTLPTVSTTQRSISSLNEVPGINGSQEPLPAHAAGGTNATHPTEEPRQIDAQTPTPLIERNNGRISVTAQPDSADGNKIITLPINTSQKFKDSAPVSSTTLPEGAQPSGKPSITSTKFPPLTTIIPTIIIIIAAITLLLQLYKYTPFGFLIGRRRKRKKRDLRRTFKIPEKPAYESPNIAVHESEDPNLVGKAEENDVYIKLLKINRYKQETQKRKKKNKKTLIEVHMEVLEEYKNDEWELHKGDFLEICLRGFINEENDDYSKLPNIELTEKSTKNDKIIEDIQKKEILWNNWIENHRNILEQWKTEEWFHILKNKWRKEQQIYKEKNNKLQENILNEQNSYSIVSQKEIWKQWISKQATLIDKFNKEDWFKSIVYAQDKEKDNYHINEYNNVTLTTETQLKNEKRNHEYSRSKDIIQKLVVQIHMMVLEECIKEDIIKHKELCVDNFIEDIHNNNNYDEKRNIPLCDTDNSKVPTFEEIHTSRNK